MEVSSTAHACKAFTHFPRTSYGFAISSLRESSGSDAGRVSTKGKGPMALVRKTGVQATSTFEGKSSLVTTREAKAQRKKARHSLGNSRPWSVSFRQTCVPDICAAYVRVSNSLVAQPGIESHRTFQARRSAFANISLLQFMAWRSLPIEEAVPVSNRHCLVLLPEAVDEHS